jgi:hypothetical protein
MTGRQIGSRSAVGGQLGRLSDSYVRFHLAVSRERLTYDLGPALGLRAGKSGLSIVRQTIERHSL